jgi:hypothetical protein
LEVDEVAVMSCLEVVILEKLFILEMSVLGLDSVQLVTKCKIVLISLLDLKDFSLQLADEKVFLVRRKVDTVVVLKWV